MGGTPLPPKAFEVLPENWDAVLLFTKLGTQWLYGPGGHRTGLRYEGCQVVVEGEGFSLAGKLLRQIQVLEDEMLRIGFEKQ